MRCPRSVSSLPPQSLTGSAGDVLHEQFGHVGLAAGRQAPGRGDDSADFAGRDFAKAQFDPFAGALLAVVDDHADSHFRANLAMAASDQWVHRCAVIKS